LIVKTIDRVKVFDRGETFAPHFANSRTLKRIADLPTSFTASAVAREQAHGRRS